MGFSLTARGVGFIRQPNTDVLIDVHVIMGSHYSDNTRLL